MDYVKEISEVARSSDTDAINDAVSVIANYCYSTAKQTVSKLMNENNDIVVSIEEAKKSAVLINKLSNKELFDIENNFERQAMELVNSLCKNDRMRRYGVGIHR